MIVTLVMIIPYSIRTTFNRALLPLFAASNALVVVARQRPWYYIERMNQSI